MRTSFIIGLSAACLFATASCGDGRDDDNGSDSLGGSEGPGLDPTGDPSADGSASASASASASGGQTSGADDGDGGGSIEPKYDLGTIPDTPEFPCGGKGGGGGGGDVQLSYIWISNSSQGTISKIDTQTVEEEGRYYAKPANGDPSRTSVNLSGDVAVANRNGGVAKFWADVNNCEDSNGQPGIQTSEGASDILPWGEDDCLAWYTPFTCSSNRPVAWTRGEWSEAACGYTNANLWTTCDSTIHLINGADGEVEESIPVPGGYVFMYGGAADGDGNFWGLDTGGSQLVRVDHETLEVETHPLGPTGGYGITVDKEGRPWTSGGGGVARFNLDDSTWDQVGAAYGIGGCMSDGDELIWHSTGSGLLQGFNIETLEVDKSVQLPEYVHGVSVDFYGYVWGVGFANNNAYRADPESGDVDTYSDMTGFQLHTAGGGAPPQG